VLWEHWLAILFRFISGFGNGQSGLLAKIGEAANIVVQGADGLKRLKYASSHDLRRGCALRLINAGVSAKTVRIIMRHKSFATTEKHYGAILGAQSAAKELAHKLNNDNSPELVGGFMGEPKEATSYRKQSSQS